MPYTPKQPCDPDEQEALSLRYGTSSAIWIVPLRSGNFSIFDRTFTLLSILDHAPTTEEIQDLSLEAQQSVKVHDTMISAARFFGEPTPEQLAKDIRKSLKAVRPTSTRNSSAPLELDL